MTSPPKNDTGLPSDLKAEFMLIKISYDCKLLLPMEEGNKFLSVYSTARQWKEGYKEPTVILPTPPEVSVRYITKAELAQVKFDAALGLDKDD